MQYLCGPLVGKGIPRQVKAVHGGPMMALNGSRRPLCGLRWVWAVFAALEVLGRYLWP